MRIIHTSDWHLGQHFYARSRAAEHQAFLEWLKTLVVDHGVDAIIVAGDIFDTATPASYARELLNQFIVSLQGTGCHLYLLAGNHDSVATLNESTALVACLNTHIITSAEEDVSAANFPLKNRQGEVVALLCAIPYLRPRDIQSSQSGLSGREKQRDLLQAMSEYYQRHYHHAQQVKDKLKKPNLPIIATGHLTALGVTKSDSVRDIYIGTLEAFPVDAFPPADYIALGHIHRAQKVGGQEHIRYAGSPIPLSFDELGQRKSVTLLEITEDKALTWSEIEIPQFQPMHMLKGSLQQIAQQLTTLPLPTDNKKIWLDIEIHHVEYLSDLQKRVEELSNDLPVEILLLRRKKLSTTEALQTSRQETLNELTYEEVFTRRLAQESISVEAQQKLLQLFRQITAEIHDI